MKFVHLFVHFWDYSGGLLCFVPRVENNDFPIIGTIAKVPKTAHMAADLEHLSKTLK